MTPARNTSAPTKSSSPRRRDAVGCAAAQFRTLTLASSHKSRTPTLDHTAFPHLVERIAHFAPPPTLFAIASTSRALRARLLPKLYAHVSLLTSRGDTYTLRSAAGTSLKGHVHCTAKTWGKEPGVGRGPPPLPGSTRVIDLHPGQSLIHFPPAILTLVQPEVIRLRISLAEMYDSVRPTGRFMHLHDSGPADIARRLVVMVERDVWLDDCMWFFDAPVPVVVAHFSRAWCTGYRQNPGSALPRLPPTKTREIILIFDYLDGVQIPTLVPALARIVAEACRPHSAETSVTIVGDTDDAEWLNRVVGDMRAQLDHYEDDRVEFDGTCPLTLVSRAEYAAKVGGTQWAIETDPAYRYVG
ncbi:hypothetical protein CC85DRAFT_124700 [Cutaneotrichosporon oleaginosum]|uniref:Uncharacterized protein n=1 Tax=Cutaneotrichosporon oleaginosum TaxID=879819 RepID=A0A0J0XJN9_9TREE|nr:uncharacterized protein CC85DRAFT_124700 [Cutaneotrichosporon oleaginosum]KLT41271.1 hypothetical protein CC85DRAFT_124700 [Cutaneotrichosporon oleaginosum]TXT14022.1 hypothetical protein COLE_00215 [Cutaneotrichosporon oleaginosum]